MNRRRFLALLGSTAVAPALPGIAATPEFDVSPAWQPRFGVSTFELDYPRQVALNAQARAAMDAVAYHTMPLAELQSIAKRLRQLAVPLPEITIPPRMFTEEAA